jgi:zinc transporter ZupT
MNECLDYQIISVVEIFIVSMIGYYLPHFFRTGNDYAVNEHDVPELHSLHRRIFRLMRVFSAGVIVGVALLHLLPDAEEALATMTTYPGIYVSV